MCVCVHLTLQLHKYLIPKDTFHGTAFTSQINIIREGITHIHPEISLPVLKSLASDPDFLFQLLFSCKISEDAHPFHMYMSLVPLTTHRQPFNQQRVSSLFSVNLHRRKNESKSKRQSIVEGKWMSVHAYLFPFQLIRLPLPPKRLNSFRLTGGCKEALSVVDELPGPLN